MTGQETQEFATAMHAMLGWAPPASAEVTEVEPPGPRLPAPNLAQGSGGTPVHLHPSAHFTHVIHSTLFHRAGNDGGWFTVANNY